MVKRDLLANGFLWSGAHLALSQLPPEDGLLVLCYHRIADGETEPYDSGLISATGDQFDDQVKFLKRKGWLVSLDEALDFVEGKETDKTPRFRVLITFDDGCLDNYETAFPILRSHGAQGVFFLCSGLVGSNAVLWWDEIAYLLKHASRRQFTLTYPARLNIDLDKDGTNSSVNRVNKLHREPDNDHERFMQELRAAVGITDPPSHPRRFLNWDEAREMIEGGMAIGGHTHSHAMLSKLKPEEQLTELTESRASLREQLGIDPDTLAYPYGFARAFTEQTEQIARDAGYRAAFSFYGGFNAAHEIGSRYNLKRVGVGGQSYSRFRTQLSISRLSGKFWP